MGDAPGLLSCFSGLQAACERVSPAGMDASGTWAWRRSARRAIGIRAPGRGACARWSRSRSTCRPRGTGAAGQANGPSRRRTSPSCGGPRRAPPARSIACGRPEPLSRWRSPTSRSACRRCGDRRSASERLPARCTNRRHRCVRTSRCLSAERRGTPGERRIEGLRALFGAKALRPLTAVRVAPANLPASPVLPYVHPAYLRPRIPADVATAWVEMFAATIPTMTDGAGSGAWPTRKPR